MRTRTERNSVKNEKKKNVVSIDLNNWKPRSFVRKSITAVRVCPFRILSSIFEKPIKNRCPREKKKPPELRTTTIRTFQTAVFFLHFFLLSLGIPSIRIHFDYFRLRSAFRPSHRNDTLAGYRNVISKKKNKNITGICLTRHLLNKYARADVLLLLY